VHSSTLGNGRTVQVRRALYDLQGQVAELADKCLAQGSLDLPVTGAELEKLRDMLAQFGDLTKTVSPGNAPSRSYQNQSGRAGFETLPGNAYEPGRPLSPLKLEEILRSNVWNDWIFRDADFFWQTSLLEPAGGMDMFAKGFLRQALARQAGSIEGLVRFGAKVVAIDVGGDKVAVRYQDGGVSHTLESDYCISTIPVPIFKMLRTNLPGAIMKAAADLPIMAAGKVGWQAERFWESNDNIYGGISWTSDVIDQIWYPSSGFLGRKGTLTGAYMRGKHAQEFDALPVAERLRLAREQGEKLHPGFFAKSVEHGIAIGWDRMEFAQMGWANEVEPDFAEKAQVLAKPQGRLHFAGDQITFWSGWQEGAVLAAWDAVRAIDRQTNPTANRG
jgi:monoamine oxidase